MAMPSGFSWARPAARRAVRFTSLPLGVASLTREAASLTSSPALEVVPVTASFARDAVSLMRDFTDSAFPATASLAREGTSAL
jgi:hypothetical protein